LLHVAQAAQIDPAALFFDPNSIVPDFYARIELPNLSVGNSFQFSAGSDPIIGANILPVLKPGEYPSSYIFSQSDYLQQAGIDYNADLTSGTLTTVINTAGLYHIRVSRQSGLEAIYAVFAEAGLKEKDGAPDKTGAEKKLDPLPDADLFLVENSDSALDDSAEIWKKAGRNVERVNSRDEAVQKIKDLSTKLGRKIHVEIDGHGTSANISTGAGKQNIADKQIDLSSVEQFQKDVDAYVSQITFQGCSVGKGDDGAKFLQILADSIGSASAWNEEVTVVDRDYFVVGRSASFVTKDKVPEPGTYALIVSGAFFLGLFKLRRRHLHFPGITQIR
jgi:hypothetical protein